MKAKDIPVPERWPLLIRQAMLHAVSIAHFSIVCALSRAENSKCYEANLKGKIDRLEAELAQVKNQNRILISRFSRIPSRQRPYYSPNERMDILCHKAACGWKLKKTAEAFLTDEATISSWMKKIDNGSLVKISVPWNKYPEFLKYASLKFKALVPTMGKKKISEYFVRSGLYLSAASIGRYLKDSPPVSPGGNDTEASEADEKIKSIKSKHLGNIWNIDLTVVPTCGLWVSWIPNALPQTWPFCWWLLVIVDHFSRKAVGFALFKKQPSSEEVTAALDKAIVKNGRKPRHIISAVLLRKLQKLVPEKRYKTTLRRGR